RSRRTPRPRSGRPPAGPPRARPPPRGSARRFRRCSWSLPWATDPRYPDDNRFASRLFRPGRHYRPAADSRPAAIFVRPQIFVGDGAAGGPASGAGRWYPSGDEPARRPARDPSVPDAFMPVALFRRVIRPLLLVAVLAAVAVALAKRDPVP